MSKEIVFEPINIEDPAQKSKIQFESKIFNVVNGKQVYADEETGFIYQEFSGFAPKKYNPDPTKRDFVKIQLDPDQQSCMNLRDDLNNYDDAFEANRKTVFGKFDRLYKFGRSVKQPKKNDEDEIEEDEDQDESKQKQVEKPRLESCKMKLKMDWFYYYNDQRLDKANTGIVKKSVGDLLNKNKNLDKDKRKALLKTLEFKLNFVEDGKSIQKEVNMGDLEQRKEIDAKIFHRRPDKLNPDAKKPFECNEDELIKFYGDPAEPKDVKSPDDLDKYYGFKCYIRLLYTPYRLWAAKTKEPDADKRKCGIKYVINSIDIIQLPYENNNNNNLKTVYSKYSFGKKSNDEKFLINQSVDTVFTSVVEEKQQIIVSDEKTKPKKKQMKVESDSEESEESEDESVKAKDESESESESEEDEEPVPVKKGKSKTVVESTKTTKSVSNRKK